MFRRAAMAGTIWLVLSAGCSGNLHLVDLFKDYRTGTMIDADHGVLLYGLDLVTTPDSRVQLRARLRSPRSLRGIMGVRISFHEDGRLLGEAITRESGVAEIDCSIGSAGPHLIDIVPTELPRGLDADYNHALEARARMLVDAEPADAKFVVIDLDHTLVDASGGSVLIRKDSPALAGAVEAMGRIGQSYHVIYLTHRPQAMTAKSRQWLWEHKLPIGVLLTAPGRQFLEANKKFKSAVLAKLRESHPGIEIGVGDQASDAAAYLENDMTPYLIPQCKPNPVACRKLARDVLALPGKDRIQVVTGWAQIERGIFDHERFTAEEFAKGMQKAGGRGK